MPKAASLRLAGIVLGLLCSAISPAIALGQGKSASSRYMLVPDNAGLFHKQLQLELARTRYLNPEGTRYWHQRRGAADAARHEHSAAHTLNLQYSPVGSYCVAFGTPLANGSKAVSTLTGMLQMDYIWWERLWWQGAIVLLVAGGIGGYLQLVRHQQRRRFHQLRTRLADDLHDELGALLVRASFQAEALKYEQPTQLATANQLLTNLQQASRAMRDIAWGIDPNANTFGSLLDRMQEFVDQLPLVGRCRISITDSGIPNEKALDAAVRQHTYYVFKEAVTNAFRHADDCETVTISLRPRGHCLVLQVENDGAPVISWRPGMGLRSMNRRAQEVGGRLKAAPRASGGFGVLLLVPLR